VKGIFPWIREALFGPQCKGTFYCDYAPLSDCISGACAYHCHRDCKCRAAPSREMSGLAHKSNGKRKTRNQFDWPEDLNI